MDFSDMKASFLRHNPSLIKHHGEIVMNPDHKEHVGTVPYTSLPEILSGVDISAAAEGLYVFSRVYEDEDEQEQVDRSTNVSHPIYEFGRRIDRSNFKMLHRMALESNPNELQIISYCLLIDDMGRIAMYMRLKYKGGERFLTDRLTAFYGGHLVHRDIFCGNEGDEGYGEFYDMPQTIARNFVREMNSEVRLFDVKEQKVVEIDPEMLEAIGFVFAPNDANPKDSGNYHLGMIGRCHVPFDCELLQVLGDMPETEFTGWIEPENLEEYLADNDNIEPWARLILSNYKSLPALRELDNKSVATDDIEDLAPDDEEPLNDGEPAHLVDSE